MNKFNKERRKQFNQHIDRMREDMLPKIVSVKKPIAKKNRGDYNSNVF